MYEPWCFNLFTSESKLHTFVVAGILYPFFVAWVLLGTVWYAMIQLEKECFKDPQQSWYIMLWLVIFYIWIIAYTTAITTSAMVYVTHTQIRQRQLEDQYQLLLGQYEGLEPPDLRHSSLWQSEGLSPGSIGRYLPHTVTPEEGSLYVCSICIEEVQPGEKIRTIDCGHNFHMACIDPWLLRQGECPNCKRNLRIPNRDMEEPLLRE